MGSIEQLRERENQVFDHVMAQFTDPTAQDELRHLGPPEIEWSPRVEHTIRTVVPRLPRLAIELKHAVGNRFNSINRLQCLIDQGRSVLDTVPQIMADANVAYWYESITKEVGIASTLTDNIESQQVSAEIQRFITGPSGLGDILSSNGRSIYPDTFLSSANYTDLKKREKGSKIDGPCLKKDKPSNVPDGCELKSNQGRRVKVDAHGAHPGLHLGVTWELVNRSVTVTGVWLAYVRIADHRESGRNVKVTTVKYSFGHDLFVSLL